MSLPTHSFSPAWLRSLLLLLLYACAAAVPTVAHAQRARVNVYHSGNDVIGLQVAHAIRETVRGSQAFQLAASEDEAEFQIRLLTQDPDRADGGAGGDRTILALSYVMMNPAPYKKDDPTTWYPFLLSTSIARAGSRRVDEAARSAIAALDKLVEEQKRLVRLR